MNWNLNCLSYWFPKIQTTMPESVPKTTIIKTNLDLLPLLDGKTVQGFDALISEITAAANDIGFPCFMRTGQTSGKHDWIETCFLKNADDVLNHVINLIEYSEMTSLIGLPYDVWVVREMLPTKPIGLAFKGMPVCKEFRVFVDGAQVLCFHPYWPSAAFKNGVPEGYNALCELNEGDQRTIWHKAAKAGHAVGGRWSVDVLWTEKGWFVTDMAVMEDSWHWPDCPLNPEREV